MEQPIKRHIDFLDPIRGLAILLVFLYHSLGASFGRDALPWGHWFREFTVTRSFLPLLPLTFGWAGVAIFFVVSGFCIHLSYSRQPDWPLFFQRRFFRIYPPYLAALLFFAFLFPITRLHFNSLNAVGQFLSHLGLVHNINEKTYFGINSSFWSIAVEVQLYVIYPLLLALVSRFGWRQSLFGLAAIELALRLTDGALLTTNGYGLPTWVSASPIAYWFSWSIGAFLAERYVHGQPLPAPRPSSCFLLALLAVECGFIKPLSTLCFFLFALLTAAVIARLLQEPESNGNPGALQRHLQNVGVWSFSLYLLHQPMLLIIPRIAEHAAPHVHLHPLVIFAICLASWAVIVPLSRLSYEYCELPSIALGKRWQKRRTARHAVPRTDSVVVDGVPPSSVVTQAAPVPPVAEL